MGSLLLLHKIQDYNFHMNKSKAANSFEYF